MTKRRDVTFIETPVSTQITFTLIDFNGDSVSTQGYNSLAANTDYTSLTNKHEVVRHRKKLVDLIGMHMHKSTPAGEMAPAADGAGN